MKKIFVCFSIFLSVFFICPQDIDAKNLDDPRVLRLRKFLDSNNSALAPHAQYLISIADFHKMPWTLIPAIAGVESTFCKFIPRDSFNCWGWNNGKTKFADFQSAVDIVARSLKVNYWDRGLTTPELIGRKYAPPTPSWGRKVRKYMNQIEQMPISSLLAIEPSF